MSENQSKSLNDQIVDVLKTIYDPEIPVDIWELGLIYDVSIRENNNVHIAMTLTTPNCPAAEILPPQVKNTVAKLDGVNNVDLDLVWDPPWNPEMMSEAAQLKLGYM